MIDDDHRRRRRRCNVPSTTGFRIATADIVLQCECRLATYTCALDLEVVVDRVVNMLEFDIDNINQEYQIFLRHKDANQFAAFCRHKCKGQYLHH